ncbi:minor tail protein [Mycobacterium phage Fowlmouth]|uniref:Minor tail protein n=1 Tax=Mycobacterium phage Fowlmouth TaxID=2419978 RepID=A0A3G2KG62_9CAUD|nr:minor tail protein [Mycobacterium phage Fowlmouth]AYN57974.1 minor tail protein [Mycobacterium phage Fowlmouth]
MTGFFSQAGFGGPPGGGSVESKALRQIDSRTKSFANKDFVKNIAWLNQSVDTLSAYTQKLQKGVDAANQNALEQILSFAADLFVLFGGGEPTGIDLGDLKYVIQGIGALLGINPDTPFPLNLFDAAWNLFGTYVVPLEQFTDVVFDAITAWAEDFGLSPELIESIQDLKDAIEALGTTFSDFFNSLHDLLSIFGTNFPVLGEFWDALVDLLTGVDISGLKPVISMLADLGIPFIQALTAIVNAGNAFLTPFSKISGSQIATLGDNVVPPASNNTTIWTVGIDTTNTWAYDSTQEAFTTLGTGTSKQVDTQGISPCNPGAEFVTAAKIRWSGIPSSANGFGYQIIWYLNQTEVSRTSVNIPSGHGSSSAGTSFVQMANNSIIVPQNVNGFKVAGYVNGTITSGQVWIKDISVRIAGKISKGIIDGIEDFLTGLSPINARNLFGLLPANIFSAIPISALGDHQPNLWPLGMFPNANVIDGKGIWTFDDTVKRTEDGTGSVRVVADGTPKALRGIETPVMPKQTIRPSVFVHWDEYLGSGAPIQLHLALYKQTSVDENLNPVYTFQGYHVVDSFTPGSSSGGWVELSGEYTIPDTDVDMVKGRLYIGPQALGGTIHFDDASARQIRKMLQEWVEGLPEVIQDTFARWQLTVDTIVNAIRNTNIFGYELEDIATALRNIPALNILGLLGPETIEETIQELVNAAVGGLVGLPGVGASLADLFNMLQQISSWATQGRWSWELWGRRDNTPIDSGLIPSSTSNFKINYINTTLACTQANSLIAAIRVEQSAPLGVVSWLGYGSAGITAFYVNIWKINKTTAARERVHHSADVKSILHPGSTDADIGWNFYFLPEPLERNAEDELFFELVPVGGTHYVRGVDTEDTIPDHPYALTKGLAATRNNTTNPDNPPASISLASWTTSSKVPWIETAIDVVSGNNNYDPVILEFEDTVTIPIPSWVNYVDVIPCSEGGDGDNGATLNFNGRPGTPAKIVATTYIRETHFTGDATLTFNKESGVASFTVGAHSISSPKGTNGSGQVFGGSTTGKGAGPFTYKGQVYLHESGDQKVSGRAGTNPGGGGAGGNGLLIPQSGGNGGKAKGWAKFRQSPVEDEGDIFDTIPPSAPDIEVVEVSFSSITVELDSPDPDVAGYDIFVDGIQVNDQLIPEEDE